MLDLGVLCQELLHLSLLYLPLIFPVDLVSHQNERELLRLLGRSLVEELRYPRLDVVERLSLLHGTRLLVMS